MTPYLDGLANSVCIFISGYHDPPTSDLDGSRSRIHVAASLYRYSPFVLAGHAEADWAEVHANCVAVAWFEALHSYLFREL